MPLSGVPALVSNGKWICVAGRFDPLIAADARRIASVAVLGTKVLAVISDNGDLKNETPLLAPADRASS